MILKNDSNFNSFCMFPYAYPSPYRSVDSKVNFISPDCGAASPTKVESKTKFSSRLEKVYRADLK